MATIVVHLTHGLRVGEDVLFEAEIREATAGDVIEAQEEAEKLMISQGLPVLVPSPTRVGVGLLRRQLARIGDVQGPLALAEIKRLHPDDLQKLQNAAETLDSAAGEALSERGRDAGVGRGPADDLPDAGR